MLGCRRPVPRQLVWCELVPRQMGRLDEEPMGFGRPGNDRLWPGWPALGWTRCGRGEAHVWWPGWPAWLRRAPPLAAC